ncbi:lysophospholipid acyltransferase family protein [Goodfellowiella coeruleoviolacea]|nr:lysophospholipid acyltransferase family protein [Goodfellowiella coeruleoviolacea]
MVASKPDVSEPTRRARPRSSASALWQTLMTVDRGLVGLTGRLRVTGGIPAALRGRPVLLAANHIGVFDSFVLVAACRRLGIAPRFLIAGGMMDAPVMGPVLSACGHLRVDRGKSHVTEAFGNAVRALRESGVPVLVYPEGRISHDPGLWPERGKTGVARMALAAGVPVIPISQWGAHEAAYWGCDTVRGWSDFTPIAASWLRAVRDRPTFQVRFGAPVDLSGLSAGTPGDAVRAHRRIMHAITDGLVPLRRAEPDRPKFHDPTRPTDGHSPWRPGAV